MEIALGEVVQPIEVTNPSRFPDGEFTYVDIGSIDNKRQEVTDPKRLRRRDAPSRARRVIRSGDVLFATVRPYLRNIALVQEELDGQVTSTGICVLRACANVLPRFLLGRVTMQSFIDQMTVASDGTMYPAISDSDLFTARMALPPLAEQRRIVSKLDALTARLARARAELERVPVLAARVRQSALEACDDGDRSGRLSPLLAAPIRNGLSIKGSEQPPGMRALRLSALRSSLVDLNDVRYLPVSGHKTVQYRLADRDLLVSRGNGTLALVGRAALVSLSSDMPATIFPDTAFRLRLDSERADARWLLYIWNSDIVRNQIEQVARTTAGIWKISQGDLAEIKLPSLTLRQQRSAVARLDAAFARADRLEAEAARAKKLLDRLEAAILAKAFQGKLVPQDPVDEPAVVLLDRIRAERAAAPKAKRGRRSTVQAEN